MNDWLRQHYLERIAQSLACECYKCVGPQYEWDEYGKRLVNDMEYHTFMQPCDDCGQPKTEYRDLGTKGRYVCWWCTERAAPGIISDTPEASA